MTATAYVKKLDAENLQMLMRCDPPRIQAEEATPEAIKTCRMMGVELLLAPGKPAKKCDCGVKCHPDAAHANRLGVQVVIGQSDLSGFKRALPEEAEKILANTRIKICLMPDGQGGFSFAESPRHGMSASPETSGTDGNSVFHALSRSLVEAGYIPGQSYEQCLEMAKWHPGMAEFMTKRLPGGVGSDIHRQQFGYAQMCASQASVASVGGEPASGRVTGRGVFSANAKALKAAGYIKGQILEHCLEMAKWHPKMEAFLRSLGAFSEQDTDLVRQFGFAVSYLEDSGSLVA